jgi:hypothetical protein
LVGAGFIVDETERDHLLRLRPQAKPLLPRYWGGSDLTKRTSKRFVVDFFGVDERGAQEAFPEQHILVITPYNAQIARLRKHVPASVPVGTVDKFQGQEAPVAIYSLATSSPADAPRGMEFLYSKNRLNVAVSRARCLSIVVGSPALFRVRCKTPRQMDLANAFCRFLELAVPR